MKYLIFILSFFPLIAMATLVEPEVINTSSTQEVKLGDVEKALSQFDKNFKLLEPRHFLSPVIGYFEGYANELPQAVSADFNGDGKRDILVMGLSMENKSVVIKALLAVSKGNKYQVLPLDQWNAGQRVGTSLAEAYQKVNGLEMYLGLATKLEKKALALPKDRQGFKIEVYQKTTTILYYKDGAIKKVKEG